MLHKDHITWNIMLYHTALYVTDLYVYVILKSKMKKLRSLKESDYKYKKKHESTQGTITDKEWESIFMVPALAPVDNKIKDHNEIYTNK